MSLYAHKLASMALFKDVSLIRLTPALKSREGQKRDDLLKDMVAQSP